MAFYTTVPVTIEAEQFTYPPSPAFRNFVGSAMTNLRKERHPNAIGRADITLEEHKPIFTALVREGEWVMLGTDGAFAVIADYLFKDRYTPTL